MQTEALTHRIGEIRGAGDTEAGFFKSAAPENGTPGARPFKIETETQLIKLETGTRLRNHNEICNSFLLRSHPHELYGRFEHLKPDKAAQPLEHLAKEQGVRRPSQEEALLNPVRTELQYLKKKELADAEALREQDKNVKLLMEKINIQEQVIDQMKNGRQGQSAALGKAEVKMVADAVLERLNKDIHLQRLRMGMS